MTVTVFSFIFSLEAAEAVVFHMSVLLSMLSCFRGLKELRQPARPAPPNPAPISELPSSALGQGQGVVDVSDEEELEDTETGHDSLSDGETEMGERGQVQQEVEMEQELEHAPQVGTEQQEVEMEMEHKHAPQVWAEMEEQAVQEQAAAIDMEPVAVEGEGALQSSDTEAVAQGVRAQQVQQPLPGGPDESAVKRARPSLAGPAGISRPKVHASPDDILGPISPKPACALRLSKTDHRWICTWKPQVNSDRWIDELSNKSFSMVFDFRNEADWQEKLAKVHEYAWEKWLIGGGEGNRALKLQDGKQPCEPGVIDPDVYNRLRPIFQSMPPRKLYGR